jgi:hypothetical protein
MSEERTFVDNYVTWDDPAFKGKKRELDKRLGEARGGNALSGLPYTEDRLRTRAADTSNKPAVRETAQKGADMAKHLRESGDVVDKPTTISEIGKNYEALYSSAIQRGIDSGTAIPGTGWYFEHRRGQEASVEPSAGLTGRQITAMGGRLSAGKTPEDETTSLGGISKLVSTEKSKAINGRTVSSIPSRELGEIASTASAWNAYDAGGSKRAPELPRPDFGGDDGLKKATVEAGRAHQENVGAALEVARGEVDPADVYDVSKTPKTAAYAEMQAQSNPGSVEEVDYHSISAHIRDVAAGTQHSGQGMFVFSQKENEPRPYPLREDSPTAIDTWMVGTGSGQPLQSTRSITDRSGKSSTRTYSPAKRLADKDFPLSPDAQTKKSLGLPQGDARITPVATVSAQHNEAIQRLSRKLGAVSFDQFGNDIYTPSSLLQETVWTEGRRQAGGDKAFNAAQRDAAKAAKQEERAAKKQAKIDARNNPTLF